MEQRPFRSLDDVTQLLMDFEPDIPDFLTKEQFEVYKFLQRNCKNSKNLTSDHVFQFVFRSFYRLDNAGLGDEFKDAFFLLFEEQRKNCESPDVSKIVRSLHTVKTARGKHSFQFSFATKMVATIDPEKPIYDSLVAELFGFNPGYFIRDDEKRITRFMRFYDELERVTRESSENRRLTTFMARMCERVHGLRDVPPTKQLDFVFWAAGKAMRNSGDGAD